MNPDEMTVLQKIVGMSVSFVVMAILVKVVLACFGITHKEKKQ